MCGLPAIRVCYREHGSKYTTVLNCTLLLFPYVHQLLLSLPPSYGLGLVQLDVTHICLCMPDFFFTLHDRILLRIPPEVIRSILSIPVLLDACALWGGGGVEGGGGGDTSSHSTITAELDELVGM